MRRGSGKKKKKKKEKEEAERGMEVGESTDIWKKNVSILAYYNSIWVKYKRTQ